MSMNDKFEDIRPYRDDEIPQKLMNISSHPWLVNFIKIIKFGGNIPDFINPFLDVIIRFYIKRLFKKIKTVEQFQRNVTVKHVMNKIIEKTTSSLTISGMEYLDPKGAYLYISNHRDIVLDSALLNLLLDKNNYIVSEIAFGDNLLINDFVADIIRINRAFIVKRKLPPKELLRASLILSEYIHMTLTNGRSIWIAQREGRAKDGNDRTNPALIKMINFYNRSRKLHFREFSKTYKVVPVAISYELDPCDRLKAWEIYNRSKRENFKKRKNDDLMNMSLGMSGKKERVHISISKPLDGNYETVEDLVCELDGRIHENYALWPNNYVAYDLYFKSEKFKDKYSDRVMSDFVQRFKDLPEAVREIAYKAYAMPLINKLDLKTTES
jgi:1-acyl-sn-glycerol-3-phosphate acyltransferase